MALFGFSPLNNSKSLWIKEGIDELGPYGPYIVVKEASIGDLGIDTPCGRDFAISIEDNRLFFSSKSAMNATIIDGVIVEPEDNSLANSNKNPYAAEIESKFLELDIGYNSDKTRLGIAASDINTFYSPHTFDIVLGGDSLKAFNSEVLLYELLIATQFLLEENIEMKQLFNELNKTEE